VSPRLNRLLRESLLWAGAVGGVICLVLGGLALAFGFKPVIFRSGSMSPAIGTGALAFTHHVDAAGLHVGDVVTVRTDKGVRVTHRIRSISPQGDQVTLVLKGDANPVVDSQAYVVGSADRVLFSIPKAGYVVNALSGRAGTFGGGILVGLVLVTAFGRRRNAPPEALAETPAEALQPPVIEPAVPGPDRPVSVRGRRLIIGAGVTLAVVTLLAGTRGTMAYFTDSATVTSGSFTMAAPPPSLITACSRDTSSGAITVTWSSYPTATSYNLTGTTPSNPNTLTNVTSPHALPVGKNNSGTVVVTAVTPGGNVTSVAWTYDGSGSNQTCHS
jgi:signal peptidase I